MAALYSRLSGINLHFRTLTMHISLNFLIIGVTQLALLITVLYTAAFLKTHYGVRVSVIDMLLLLIQVLNLSVLPRCVMRENRVFVTSNGSDLPMFTAQCALILLSAIRFAWLLRKAAAHSRQLLITQSVRETVNYLPGGICFATPGGKPILTNYRMNDLIYRLTEHTIINTQTTWEELRHTDFENGCVRLENIWPNMEKDDKTADESVYFLFPDSRIWRFRKERLTESPPVYIQLEATDITDLYRYSKDLYENNLKLAEQHKRLRNLLANIIEINREKEIISTKMKIHDALGRSIITTKQHLTNQTLNENITGLIEIWNNTIRGFTDFAQTGPDTETSPEIELLRAADMIGCQINFDGDRPADREAALLLYALVREGLTNAVRHAGASRLDVAISPTDSGYHVEITDNGTAPAYTPAEGSGLGNLRRRLEQEGAALEIKTTADGVVLAADIPVVRKTAIAQRG